MTGIKFKNWKSYVFAFLMSWIYFVIKIVSNRPAFTDEYGWMAYQPFNFFVIFCTLAIGNFLGLAKKTAEEQYYVSDKLLMCAVYSVKVTVAFSIVAIIYVYILGNKPSLLICL